MWLLPRDSTLGHLELVQVLDFYDFPRTFVCRNRTGSEFLVFSVEQSERSLKWLYIPVSRQRLRNLRRGQLTLRSAILEAEEAPLHVEVDLEGRSSLTRAAVPDEWLPADGEYYHPTRPDAEDSLRRQVQARALRGWRDVIDVAFHVGPGSAFEVPARTLSGLILGFQQTIEALAAAKRGLLSQRGRLPEDLLGAAELCVVGTFRGSFGVRLRATQESDLFGQSVTGEGMKQLLEVARLGADEPNLFEFFRVNGPRATSRYREFLERLDDASAWADVDWGSPEKGSGSALSLDRDLIRASLRVLQNFELAEVPEVTIIAKLVAANVRTKTYELMDTKNARKYSGRVADDAMHDVEHATLSETYRSRLKELSEVNSLTGEERRRWILVGLQPI